MGMEIDIPFDFCVHVYHTLVYKSIKIGLFDLELNLCFSKDSTDGIREFG